MSVTSLLYLTSIICAFFAIPVEGDKTCRGTINADIIPGGYYLRYEFYQDMYTNCTHVFNNLEIISLRTVAVATEYDLSFLKDIRYVAGYVRITGIDDGAPTMPLDNLQIIRGNQSFYDPHTDKSYTLAVINNPGLRRLHLYNLREITEGSAHFEENVNLKYVEGIQWGTILRQRNAQVNHTNGFTSQENYTTADNTLNCPGNYGWDDNPLKCQAGINPVCNSDCNGRCFGTGATQCCHNLCAIGCTGGSTSSCTACTDFKWGSRCVEFCPSGDESHVGMECYPSTPRNN